MAEAETFFGTTKQSPADVRKKVEQSDRRREFIDRRYKQAEKDFYAGEAEPEIIFSWQRRDAVSTDFYWDRDPASFRRANRLPAKQGVVMPNGEFGWDLGEPGDAAYEAARLKLACAKCRGKMPDSDKAWEKRMQRLEARIGPCPEPRNRGERCCDCGCLLGLAGDADDAQMNPLGMTPEQTELMNRMAGPDWYLR